MKMNKLGVVNYIIAPPHKPRPVHVPSSSRFSPPTLVLPGNMTSPWSPLPTVKSSTSQDPSSANILFKSPTGGLV